MLCGTKLDRALEYLWMGFTFSKTKNDTSACVFISQREVTTDVTYNR